MKSFLFNLIRFDSILPARRFFSGALNPGRFTAPFRTATLKLLHAQPIERLAIGTRQQSSKFDVGRCFALRSFLEGRVWRQDQGEEVNTP